MSFKNERLEKIMIREISTALFNSKDERLKVVTVTKVSLTKDLSYATIYYTVLKETKNILDYLNDASGYLRTHLAKALDIRKVPVLKFKYDESGEYGSKIESILKGLK